MQHVTADRLLTGIAHAREDAPESVAVAARTVALNAERADDPR